MQTPTARRQICSRHYPHPGALHGRNHFKLFPHQHSPVTDIILTQVFAPTAESFTDWLRHESRRLPRLTLLEFGKKGCGLPNTVAVEQWPGEAGAENLAVVG